MNFLPSLRFYDLENIEYPGVVGCWICYEALSDYHPVSPFLIFVVKSYQLARQKIGQWINTRFYCRTICRTKKEILGCGGYNLLNIKILLFQVTTVPTCCGKWLHQQCLRKYAINAGYAFMCPICGDKNYGDFARSHGIFVPE